MVSFGVGVELIHADKVDFKAFYTAMEKCMERTVQYSLRAYRNTIGGWEHDVPFVVEKEYGAGGEYFDLPQRIVVYSPDEVYQMVDVGTAPHMIVPRQPYNANGRPSALSFQRHYRPSTRVGKLDSHASERTGETVFSPYAMHPGIAARNFTEVVAERAYDILDQELSRRLDPAMRRCMYPLVET